MWFLLSPYHPCVSTPSLAFRQARLKTGVFFGRTAFWDSTVWMEAGVFLAQPASWDSMVWMEAGVFLAQPAFWDSTVWMKTCIDLARPAARDSMVWMETGVGSARPAARDSMAWMPVSSAALCCKSPVVPWARCMPWTLTIGCRCSRVCPPC